jgi:LacI family transcriptional regulator
MANFQTSQKEIAARAGVSRATVSYALRNPPKILQATRRRVIALAEELGYRPDPLVRKLMVHLATGRERRTQATVALFIPGYPPSSLEHDLRLRPMLAGAQSQADRHGLHFEQLWLEGVPRMTLTRPGSMAITTSWRPLRSIWRRHSAR